MSKKDTDSYKPSLRFVSMLPDLIVTEDYNKGPEQKKIRVRIEMTEKGIEILADSPFPGLLDELLEMIGAKEIERMLCG
jgi:hypothetical protein